MRVEKYAEGTCEFLTIDGQRIFALTVAPHWVFYTITNTGFEACSIEASKQYAAAYREQQKGMVQ